MIWKPNLPNTSGPKVQTQKGAKTQGNRQNAEKQSTRTMKKKFPEKQVHSWPT